MVQLIKAAFERAKAVKKLLLIVKNIHDSCPSSSAAHYWEIWAQRSNKFIGVLMLTKVEGELMHDNRNMYFLRLVSSSYIQCSEPSALKIFILDVDFGGLFGS